MHFLSTVASALLLAGTALAQTGSTVTVHVVTVSTGDGKTLKYSPNSITANPGEMVQFQFMGGNHSVTQSTFGAPCTPISTTMSNVTGFFSGFQKVAPGATSIPTYTLMVNNTSPIWFYCSQAKHCESGMVGAINAPTSGNKTIEAYTALAMMQTVANSVPGSVSAGAGGSVSSNTTSAGGSSSGGSSSGSGTSSGSGSSTTSGIATASSGAAIAGIAGSQEVLAGASIAGLISAFLML